MPSFDDNEKKRKAALKKKHGASTQRKQGGNAAQLNNGRQDASGVGAQTGPNQIDPSKANRLGFRPADPRFTTDVPSARELGSSLRSVVDKAAPAVKTVLAGAGALAPTSLAERAVKGISSTVGNFKSEFKEGFSPTVEQSLEDQAIAEAATEQEESALGVVDTLPTAAARPTDLSREALERAGEVERRFLLSQRGESPGQQGSRIGAFTEDGSRLPSNGGTFNTLSSQQDTTGRDRAVEQLEALREIRGVGQTRSSSNDFIDSGEDQFQNRLDKRNAGIKTKLALENIDRAIRRGAVAFSVGEAAKEKLRSNLVAETQREEQMELKAAQDGLKLGQQSRALDIKERGIAADERRAAADAAISSAASQRKQEESSRQFALDVAKFGTKQANDLKKQRLAEDKFNLSIASEARQQQQTGLDAQRTQTGKVAQIGKFLRGRSEGSFTDVEAIRGISKLGANPLDYFNPDSFKKDSPERALLRDLEERALLEEQSSIQKLGK